MSDSFVTNYFQYAWKDPCLDRLTWVSGQFELPATQQADEVLEERKIPVTHQLVKAADTNPFAGQEKLKSFLERNRS